MLRSQVRARARTLQCRSLVSLVLALALGFGVACQPGTAPSASAPPNIVLIVVDSLRADRLGCYGAKRITSPSIDSLAAEGVLFERAYSTASWTQPSVASLLTGLFPSGHGLQRIGQSLDAQLPTLVSALAEEGWATGGVVSHLLLGQRFGFARGFERFDETQARGHEYISTPGVTDKAIGMLHDFTQARRPFLLFVHYFDPHYSYMDHVDSDFARPRNGRIHGGETINEVVGLLPTLTKDELRTLRALYDEEIRETDEGVKRLLRALAELDMSDDTIVALVADHGEEFIDHGFVGHTYTLYEEIVRVPLVVRIPARLDGGASAGRRITAPVSTAGLAPWLLELVGLPGERLHAQAPSLGQPLTALLAASGASPTAGTTGTAASDAPPAPSATGSAGAQPEATPILSEVDYVEWAPPGTEGQPPRATSHTRKRSLVDGHWKLVRDETSGRSELYDLDSDPHERDDLAAEHPERSAELAAQLDREVERIRGASPAGGAVDIAPDEAAALRALGYATP